MESKPADADDADCNHMARCHREELSHSKTVSKTAAGGS